MTPVDIVPQLKLPI